MYVCISTVVKLANVDTSHLTTQLAVSGRVAKMHIRKAAENNNWL